MDNPEKLTTRGEHNSLLEKPCIRKIQLCCCTQNYTLTVLSEIILLLIDKWVAWCVTPTLPCKFNSLSTRHLDRRYICVFRTWVLICSVKVITLKVFRSPPWLGWPLWNICVTNDYGYVPLVVITSRFFPHSLIITGFVTRITRRAPLVE